MLSDIEIATSAVPRPITEVAARYGIDESKLELRGPYIAKLEGNSNGDGRVVLVTAVSPTPSGEGKTTTSIGLCDALNRIGVKSALSLREPSMGPVFGLKGGAAGGGYAQVIPMVDINLEFTGDFGAVAAAHNLLSAMIDNHIQQGNALRLDARQIWWRRVIDANDRALRSIVVGLGGTASGFPREDGFDIVSASEVMAILCLATDLQDLRDRLGRIVVGLDLDGNTVTAEQIGTAGAMGVILRNAVKPNLVQTLEGNLAFVHGGPFANIAHGCSSLISIRAAKACSDVVITEAGFGSDLGAEKYLDILSRNEDAAPSAAVLVATVRSIKYQSGVAVADLHDPDPQAVRDGMANLQRHLRNLTEVFGIPTVVALNRFPSDSDAEIQAVQDHLGVPCVVATHFSDGGPGAEDLARAVQGVLEVGKSQPTHAYELSESYEQKLSRVAQQIYGASSVVFEPSARKRLKLIEQAGLTGLPICVAKTQSSFSTTPSLLGAPTGHTLSVREVRLSAGAGFVVMVAGAMLTMPGLPRHPAALDIDIDEAGRVVGLS